jgi:hypothetical protein
MNSKKAFLLNTFGVVFLTGLPVVSHADYCADIKAHYWKCARASMIGETCEAEDNVNIPAECLNAGTEKESSGSGSATPSDAPSFFKDKKESKPFVYQPEVTPKKPVKVVNIKPENRKIYLETEDEVEQFTTKIHDDLLSAIRDGKRVRLQFE